MIDVTVAIEGAEDVSQKVHHAMARRLTTDEIGSHFAVQSIADMGDDASGMLRQSSR
jgi:hypothetical protein